MKTLLTLLSAVVVVASAFGQITISSADISATLAVGNSINNHYDTLTTTADIGAPGGTANSWNFSTLATHRLDTLQSVVPSGTPYISWFPGATHALKSRQTLMGITGTGYQYLTLSTNLLNRGNGGSGPTIIGTAVLKTTNTPAEVFYQLPMTLGTTWSTSYVESLLVTIGGIPFLTQITNYAVTHTVDAYGMMTLPGTFGSHEALRVRADVRFNGTSGSGRTISYQFIARNSASVQVTAADTLQPSTGTIHIDSSATSWNGPTPTDVRASADRPTEFALMQNYPNPFNPSTTFAFDIPYSSFIVLKVYDLLGREVATPVKEELPAGEHTKTWDASGMPSGVYLYRLQAGAFAETRKLILLR